MIVDAANQSAARSKSPTEKRTSASRCLPNADSEASKLTAAPRSRRRDSSTGPVASSGPTSRNPVMLAAIR
jgi:hypothetical protein